MRRECRGERFPRCRFQRKPIVSDPGMHYKTPNKNSSNQTNKNKQNKTRNLDAAAGCSILLVFSSCYSPHGVSVRFINNFFPLNAMPFISSFTLQTAQTIVGVRFASTTVTAHGLVIASLAIALTTACQARWDPFVRKVRLVINDRKQILRHSLFFNWCQIHHLHILHSQYCECNFIIYTKDTGHCIDACEWGKIGTACQESMSFDNTLTLMHNWLEKVTQDEFIMKYSTHGPLASYVNLRVTHASGMPGTFPRHRGLSDPDMHHGTCVPHVPWCMPG